MQNYDSGNGKKKKKEQQKIYNLQSHKSSATHPTYDHLSLEHGSGIPLKVMGLLRKSGPWAQKGDSLSSLGRALPALLKAVGTQRHSIASLLKCSHSVCYKYVKS